jgi:acylphosphatase
MHHKFLRLNMNQPTEADLVRMHATVEGRVQGVGFRYFVEEQALRLDVKGWVRNRWDQSVEVLAEGNRPALERLVAQLQRGPSAAYVSRLQVEWEQASGEFRDFRVRSTV